MLSIALSSRYVVMAICCPRRDALGPGTAAVDAKTSRRNRQVILLIGKQIEREPGRTPELERKLGKQQHVRLERRIHVRRERFGVRRRQIAFQGVILRLIDRRPRPPILGPVPQPRAARRAIRRQESRQKR